MIFKNQWGRIVREKKMKKNDSPEIGYCIQYTYASFKIPKSIKMIKY